MRRQRSTIVAGAVMAALLCASTRVEAQATAPPLGTAQNFAVVGATTVTNTGSSLITGDLGLSPGTSVTGFPPGQVIGTIHAANAVALQAQTDTTTAYNNLAGQTCTSNRTGQDLGGQTLTTGVYCYSSSAGLTGTVILDAQGNPNAVFIFQIGSTLTTASNASVVLINGAQSCNVFWQVGSSATLGGGTTFVGNVLALTTITLVTNAGVSGRLLARNGAVNLDTNTVVRATCATAPGPGCPAITLSPILAPNGTVGVAYNQTITASGGTAPYTFAVTAGALPAGLTLTTAGVLAGTPTTAGGFGFTVRATDANGCFAEITYAVVIASAVPTLAQWAMIALSGLLAVSGYVALRRRRPTAW
jgi:hypothetical protein